MTAMGQQQTFRDVCVTSALPLKADTRQRNCDVRFGPIGDIPLFDYLVCGREQLLGDGDAQ
jgi:hypothetical protein